MTPAAGPESAERMGNSRDMPSDIKPTRGEIRFKAEWHREGDRVGERI